MSKRTTPHLPRRAPGYRRRLSGRGPLDTALNGRPYRYKTSAPKSWLRFKRILALLHDELRRDRSSS